MSDPRMRAQEEAEEYNRSLPRFAKIMKAEKEGLHLKPVRKDARRLENGDVVGKDLIETGIDVLNAGVGAPLAKRPRPYVCPPPGPAPQWMLRKKSKSPRERNVKQV